MKIEFHSHTSLSFDCDISLKDRVTVYDSLGFDKVYITDHDRAHKRKNLPPLFRPGIEVSTAFGHIVLLNCERRPSLNCLWYLLFLKAISKNKIKIIIPHALRLGSGFFREYYRKSLGELYINWFLNNSDGFEYFNLRDREDLKSVNVTSKTITILNKKRFKLETSDSHYNDDIHRRGTILTKDGEVLLDKLKFSSFISKLKPVESYPKFRIWNLLRVLRMNVLYFKI